MFELIFTKPFDGIGYISNLKLFFISLTDKLLCGLYTRNQSILNWLFAVLDNSESVGTTDLLLAVLQPCSSTENIISIALLKPVLVSLFVSPWVPEFVKKTGSIWSFPSLFVTWTPSIK